MQEHTTHSRSNDDGKLFYEIHARRFIGDMSLINYCGIGDGEGVIEEDDSEDEEGYMFAGIGTLDMFHVVACTSCA